ncbi:hypothetical protein TVAG_161820 [Trichomonas vaginalis G3]|uniref:Uncharacterized protein n=1 Tax=Trichomonas vaginalis (strain ATCC PRA-98 / G3) TaxID=412133 RepID=A2EUQ5_TRIV3|nr:hypothetical protein TVAGG3_0255920 [Trichomonas vaginalis G3]EAY03643.1 hypothetical protein TVAG_161820 [Trichomonas vaginalis G3]KAI5524737.1 hypothetical protein TVAGG3_0255920 [Trichomonas vaginalis G3]|eukprot:XP_001315866.1 hypothetical protein [Trichomonas vaginalis G3]
MSSSSSTTSTTSTPQTSSQSSTTTSSSTSREQSPSTRNFRALSPFITPDKQLDRNKYNQFLKNMDVIEMHYYSQSFKKLAPRYDHSIVEPAQKMLNKRRYSKIATYIFLVIIICIIIFKIDI